MASSANMIGPDLRPGMRPQPSGGGNRPRSVPAPTLEASLASLVQGEIIPRLMLAHGLAQPAPAASSLSVKEVAAFAPLALDGDTTSLLAAAERLIARGVAVDRIMVDLLAPAARQLGTWWEEDRCDFIEVTMGLWRLQEVLREIGARAAPPRGAASRRRRALFTALPGDQHDFGAVLVGEMFHRHGWTVDGAPGATMPDLLAAVGRERYDLVGLTVSCDCHSARLPSAILALRSVSLNPRVRIMVGGRIFVADPALAVRVGADGTAPDAFAALAIADMLVEAVTDMVAWS